MDNYIFRREFDFATNFPKIVLDMKRAKQFQKLSLTEQNDLYDKMYEMTKKYFLSSYVPEDERRKIENAATQQILERGLQEWEKTMQ